MTTTETTGASLRALIHTHTNKAHNHDQAATQADERGDVARASYHRAEARMHRNWVERLTGGQA